MTTVPLNNLTDTWNNGATVFTGLKYNITDTASDAASLFLDFQIATVSKFSILKTGKILLPDGTASATSIQKAGFANTGIFFVSGQFVTSIAANGITVFTADTATVNVNATLQISGTASNEKIQISDGSAYSINLYGESVGTLAQRNGTTNAQTFRVYNTFTDSSNYERGVFDWTTTANTLTIGTQALGTGTGRTLILNAQGGHLDLVVNTTTFLSCVQGVGVSIQGAGVNTVYFGSSGNSGGLTGPNGVPVVQFTQPNAGGVTAWMQWAGQARVTSDFSKTSDTTLAAVTGLSVALIAGRTYSFTACLMCTDAAAGGVKCSIDTSSTLTATDIVYQGYIVDSAAIVANTQATSLGTTVDSGVTTGTTPLIMINGTITVNAAGDLVVMFAQNTINGTASTVKRGSYLIVQDMK